MLSSPVKWLSFEHKALMRRQTKGTRFWYCIIKQRYSMNQIPAAIQTCSFSNYLLLLAVGPAWPWGQLLTLLLVHFLLSLPAASPLFSVAPWKGGSNKYHQPPRRQTASFCLWLLQYHQAVMAQRKPVSVETIIGSQTHLTEPSFLLTHSLCRRLKP